MIDPQDLGKDRDGCEWNPDTNSPAFQEDKHFQGVRAEWVVGRRDNYRLCDTCAALPRFSKRTKTRIKR
jgi:hypothetical protein